MSNLAVLPIIIPLIAGIILAFFPKWLTLVRILSKIFIIGNLAVVSFAAWLVFNQGSIILETGDWAAPYEIIIVADQLSILLVLTTNVVAAACAFYAPHSLSDRHAMYYFYTFFLMLISWLSCAFLTCDIFNLFVFFEVLLMASYGLIVRGGDKVQLRESLKYVFINRFSSLLFVTAVGFLYGAVGTVNMAQIAQRVQEVDQQGILTTVGILLFFVFAVKAALFPLYYWMPKSYARSEERRVGDN